MDSEALALEQALKELRKNMEKSLVRQIGSNCAQIANNKKKTFKTLEAEKLQSLKASSASYLSNFKSSAKGKWVNQATEAFSKTGDKLNEV